MKLKYLFLITLISFNLPLNASAGEKVKSKITSDKTVASETNSNTSSKKALAKEFLDKSGFGNTFIKQLITNVLSDTVRAGEITNSQSTLDPKIKEKAARRLKALRLVFTEDINMTDTLVDVFADLMARDFTEDELKSLANFYASKTGKKWVDLTPEIARESKILSQTIVGPKLDKALQEAIKEECDFKLFQNGQ